MKYKAVIVVGLSLIVTALHYSNVGVNMGLHLLHRELYFVPILLASLWFGLRVGLFASLCVSVVFLPPLLSGSTHGETFATMISQVVMFNVVAGLVGILSDRRNEARERAFTAEKQALVGRAVSAVAYELKDITRALGRLFEQSEGFAREEFNQDFKNEISQMDRLIHSLARFIPPVPTSPLLVDINYFAKTSIDQLKEFAAGSGVKLIAELDGAGCRTSAVSPEFMVTLKALLKNAIEASPEGAAVTIVSKRESDGCVIEVRDKGQGLAPEHRDKIFTPFFSTKMDGYGLTLALAKRDLNAIGGDISLVSEPGNGTTLHLKIPRERKEHAPYEAFSSETSFRSMAFKESQARLRNSPA